MKRETLRYFLLAILFIIIALFLLLPNKINLSPEEYDLTKLEPENLLSFYLRFTAEVNQRLGVSPSLSPSENLIDNSLPNSFSNSPACGEVVCKSFTAEIIIEDFWNEFNLLKEEDKERWMEIYNRPDVQEAIKSLNSQISEFISSIECPEGCPNKITTLDYKMNITPLDEQSGECRGESKINFITQGNFWTGVGKENSCLYAFALAIQKGHSKIKNIANQTCGENCGFAIEGLSVKPLSCETTGLLNDWRKVKIEFKDKLKCSGESSTGRYKLTITANVCVTCSENTVDAKGSNYLIEQ